MPAGRSPGVLGAAARQERLSAWPAGAAGSQRALDKVVARPHQRHRGSSRAIGHALRLVPARHRKRPGTRAAHGQEARTTDYLMTNRVENLTSARESIGAGYLLVRGETVVAAGAVTGL